RPEGAADRHTRPVGSHGDEERGPDARTPEQREQPGHALLEPAPRVDVDAQGYGRLNHSIVRPRPARLVLRTLTRPPSGARPAAGRARASTRRRGARRRPRSGRASGAAAPPPLPPSPPCP